MAPLACQQWPRTSAAIAEKRAAIVTLPITVMIVTPPARTAGKISFQHGIDYCQRVLDERIAGTPNSIAHQFKKAWVHDLCGPKFVMGVRRLIANRHQAVIRILVWHVSPIILRIDSYVVALDPGK